MAIKHNFKDKREAIARSLHDHSMFILSGHTKKRKDYGWEDYAYDDAILRNAWYNMADVALRAIELMEKQDA